ncbi:hypothetical protein [Candidatus Symbiopectobacterium sp. NZEC135]|uniref:hypothetical protein n=1 Tax=Candidatus Symbiopectobacterium sp. NZEC135 TaxID=2820471 RepID=UPI0022265E1C|nr:hypothetical protein [Candidatus Symbiopectobacterium sp. NZEC135]MCW2480887.1 hypothetical protein [Candidatus Symbiopectobacterium sp. NZEC135]
MMKQLSWLLLLFSSISMASIPTDSWRLRYDERGLPLIDVQIVNRLHTLMLDTGSGESIHLHKYDLDKLIAHPSLNATQQAPRRLIDVSGGENKVSAWKFNRLLISNISFYDVEVVSFKPWGLSIGGGQPVNEVLGLGLFHNRRVLMDFKHDRLQMLDHLPSDMGNWSSYPIEKTASGLRITAAVRNTPLRLIVDTGASHSLLFSDRLPAGTLFSGCRVIEPEASNLDCRVSKIIFTDDAGKFRDDLAIVTNGKTPPEVDFDGLLGMKFMRGHKVIIDMPERMLHISR